MKKRLLCMVLAVIMLLSLLPVSVFAAETVNSGTLGENITWTLDTEGCLTVSGKGDMPNCTESPWPDKNAIKKVVIEDGVSSVGIRAFSNCKNLTDVSLPDSVMLLEYQAFYGCEKLSELELPQNGMVIREYALNDTPFYNNAKWVDGALYIQNYLLGIEGNPESYTVKEGTLGIGDNMFGYKSTLKEISLPSSLKSIGSAAFRECKNLKEVVLPEGMLYIYSSAFLDSGIEKINLPDSICRIGDMAFYRTALKTVKLPASLETIEPSTFSYCKELVSVELPDDLKTIEDFAFHNCSSLKSVDIPDGVTEIPVWGFYNCSSLAEITLPDSVKSLGSNAFTNTAYAKNEANWIDNILYLGSFALMCRNSDKLEFRDGTRCIEMEAFNSVRAGSVSIPASMEVIEANFGNIADIYYYGSFDQWLERNFKEKVDFSVTEVHFMGEGGHEHDCATVTEVPESCTKPGYTRHECDCGYFYDDNFIAPHHVLGEWYVYQEGDCETDRIEVRDCQKCGYKDNRVTKAEGHSFVDNVCTKCGIVEYPFTDISESGYKDYIIMAAELGIIGGYPDGTYRPNDNVTRGQFVTMLYRMCGEPEFSSSRSFKDVDSGSPYYKAILWAADNGITTGYNDGTFCPGKQISRAEMATFAYRFLIDESSVTPDVAAELYANPGFSDYWNIASVFRKPVCAMSNLGIIQGFNGGYFGPNLTANRGQAATIILRVYALLTEL